MKSIFLFFFSTILLFLSCNHIAEQKKNQNHSEATKPKVEKINQLEVHKSQQLKANQTSPIKIIKATLRKNRYSDHKDIQITFKNTGKKNIQAIKLEWFCKNSFNKPANGRNFYGEGRFTENSIYLLKPNQERTEFWEDFSTDANTITKIRAFYIVFTDGTKWGTDKTFNSDLSDSAEIK